MGTMTTRELQVAMAGVLTTALETEPASFPESMVYLVLGADLSKWETLKYVLVSSRLVTTEGHSVKLTDRGRELAKELNKAMAPA